MEWLVMAMDCDGRLERTELRNFCNKVNIILCIILENIINNISETNIGKSTSLPALQRSELGILMQTIPAPHRPLSSLHRKKRYYIKVKNPGASLHLAKQRTTPIA
jgi:hypothetical protein